MLLCSSYLPLGVPNELYINTAPTLFWAPYTEPSVNNAYVPVDFYVLDVEYNASCPITLERPFLRTVGAIIDMKEGTIKYHFPFKKGIEHFPMRREKLIFSPPLKARFDVNASSFENTSFLASCA